MGSPGPELSVELGNQRQINSVSGDGRTVIYEAGDEFGGVLHLDPARWTEHICSVIGRREFTDTERAGLPPWGADQPLCT